MHMQNQPHGYLIDRIKVRRKEIGLTQQKLADAADVHVNVIRRLEKGDYNPSIAVLLKIFKALDWQIEVTHSKR